MASGGGARGSGAGGGRVVGDYILGREIGRGAFSVVWRARHRVRGTEVAVKEIVMDRLSKKLQDNLLSEVFILRRINHPNIIALYDSIQVSGRIYLILEYCRGGDLFVYIQNHGRVQEATAKYFMRQLASGLQVLRDNNVIHRDLKPQNLLLSTYDENAVLKIADFGFARSLQPRGLAETLCGSPLYMAPEVMQFQKYDAKADLWSVGIILYQLVTGKTPFTGNSQIQLLQNIKTNELRFPSDYNLGTDCIDLCQKLLRRNAVERLTFEEFFNHQFLSDNPTVTSRLVSNTGNSLPLVDSTEASPSGESSHDDCLPFPLDDEPTGRDGNQSLAMNKSSVRSTYGFSVDTGSHKNSSGSPLKNVENISKFISKGKMVSTGYQHDFGRSSGISKETKFAMDQGPASDPSNSKDPTFVDSLEFVDQEYVLVPEPPLDLPSSSDSISRAQNSSRKSESSPLVSPNFSPLSAPMPIAGAAVNNVHTIGSLGSHSSPASANSQGSIDMGDAIEQPSAHCMTRIRSLQQYASAISELVKDMVGNGRQLEAFSVQLVVLAIWKQALHIFHTQVMSAIEGIASYDDSVCSQIEREFLLGVGHAEELAVEIGQMAEATEMPDAIEIIFQSALTLGRHGAVDEMMGNTERASSRYSKALCLLYFLLGEAPSLALNPPFSLTNSDRYRLRSYIDVLGNRQGQSRIQRMGVKYENQ